MYLSYISRRNYVLLVLEFSLNFNLNDQSSNENIPEQMTKLMDILEDYLIWRGFKYS